MSGALWSSLELSGALWSSLELSGAVWSCMDLSGALLTCLGGELSPRPILHVPQCFLTKVSPNYFHVRSQVRTYAQRTCVRVRVRTYVRAYVPRLRLCLLNAMFGFGLVVCESGGPGITGMMYFCSRNWRSWMRWYTEDQWAMYCLRLS